MARPVPGTEILTESLFKTCKWDYSCNVTKYGKNLYVKAIDVAQLYKGYVIYTLSSLRKSTDVCKTDEYRWQSWPCLFVYWYWYVYTQTKKFV